MNVNIITQKSEQCEERLPMSALNWVFPQNSSKNEDSCKSDLIGKTSREGRKQVRKMKEVKEGVNIKQSFTEDDLASNSRGPLEKCPDWGQGAGTCTLL